MVIKCLSNTFNGIGHAYDQFNFAFFRLLTEPLYTPRAPKNQGFSLSKIFGTLAQKAQSSCNKFIFQKSASGDYAPKPTARVLSNIAMEAQLLGREMLPTLTRNISPATVLSCTILACVVYLSVNDESVKTISDQINHYAALINHLPDFKDLRLPQGDNSASYEAYVRGTL